MARRVGEGDRPPPSQKIGLKRGLKISFSSANGGGGGGLLEI